MSERMQSISCHHPANLAQNTNFVLQQFTVFVYLQRFANHACFTWQSVRESANRKDITNPCPRTTRETTASQSKMLWIQLKKTDKSYEHR
ncbi:hypothetical protein QUB56_33100 [Microcoleus sp. AR_TQ3_B6]|uniref:hypothetical protein n=1 Tax=Microcoleus sp. AR_TQ3_B6 TaxID=3055284 RepID=UPI002FCF9F53